MIPYNELDTVKFRKVLLQTFRAFIVFCNENNINYFVSSGTALGVVRHHGFIPWDDDIDVYMKRDDYKNFINNRHKLDSRKYEIIDIHTCNYNHAFAKFCDANTTIWENCTYPFVVGVWIDVFPLDYISGSISSILQQKKPYAKAWSKYLCTTRTIDIQYFKDLFTDYRIKAFPRIFFHLWNRIFLHQERCRNQFLSIEKSLYKSSGDYLFCYCHTYPLAKELFNPDWFSDYINMEFEGISVRIAKGYHEYLSTMFGNYMELPPQEKRVSHHRYYFVDLDKRLTIEEIKKI